MSPRLRRFALATAVVVGIAAAGALAVMAGLFERSVVEASADAPLTPQQMKGLVERGRYLARAADCAACHTAPGGAPLAGGLAFPMPFGTLYATNITPDAETGIGRWTRAQFQRALRDGVAPRGHLYPAMPYVSYRQLTANDTDAIYAYVMSRPPIRQENRANSFPFDYVRPTLAFWNLLNLPARGFVPDTTRPNDWNRGKYLVDALGHCGECHTPRDLTLGMIAQRYLQGTRIENVDAPDVTPTGLLRMGFDAAALARYLPAGTGPQGVMNFSMYDVVHNSTRWLTKDDAAAMATYLTALQPMVSASLAAAPASTLPPAGRQTYLQLCSACHGVDGEGIAHVAPPMRTNASLRVSSPRNLLVVIADGLPERALPDGERYQAMPAFGHVLDDQQIADLATWLRGNWGGTSAAVRQVEVQAVRPKFP
ncbi:Cytochrome c, mono-and diheme variants [Rhodospirillales bacterium URHD0017]|nr:Cytochrome c, mono-and diheme variants [Rhodospirillales bacterium URHD0017]